MIAKQKLVSVFVLVIVTHSIVNLLCEYTMLKLNLELTSITI